MGTPEEVMTERYSPSSIPPAIMGLLAIVGAFCCLGVTAIGAFADTVRIFDQAGVLDSSSVRSDAETGAAVPHPLDIYTINYVTGSPSFDQYALSKIADPSVIVLAIDVAHHDMAMVAGSRVPLSMETATMAREAFVTEWSGSQNYTRATIAAIDYLKNSGPLDQMAYFLSGLLSSLLSTFFCANGIDLFFGPVLLRVLSRRSIRKQRLQRGPQPQRSFVAILLMGAGMLVLADGIFLLVSGVGTNSGPGSYSYSSATTGGTAIFIPEAFVTMRASAIPGMAIGVMLLLIGLVIATWHFRKRRSVDNA